MKDSRVSPFYAEELEAIRKEQRIQLIRIGQIQLQLDAMSSLQAKKNPLPKRKEAS